MKPSYLCYHENFFDAFIDILEANQHNEADGSQNIRMFLVPAGLTTIQTTCNLLQCAQRGRRYTRAALRVTANRWRSPAALSVRAKLETNLPVPTSSAQLAPLPPAGVRAGVAVLLLKFIFGGRGDQKSRSQRQSRQTKRAQQATAALLSSQAAATSASSLYTDALSPAEVRPKRARAAAASLYWRRHRSRRNGPSRPVERRSPPTLFRSSRRCSTSMRGVTSSAPSAAMRRL